jgi:two-component system CheB/CheR fusion protein
MSSESFQAIRVLVVDDDKDSADSLARLLRLGGHDAQVAYTGPIALLMIEKQKPDVVLLDIGLPQMDGYQVARKLREQPATQDLPIVAVTGYGQASDIERSKAAGMNLHLVKPVSVEDILTLLRQQEAWLSDPLQVPAMPAHKIHTTLVTRRDSEGEDDAAADG